MQIRCGNSCEFRQSLENRSKGDRSFIGGSRSFCSKPKSRSLSASSKTSHLSSLIWKAEVFSKWSRSLPGVATITWTPFLSRAFSLPLFSPPVKDPATWAYTKRVEIITCTGLQVIKTNPVEDMSHESSTEVRIICLNLRDREYLWGKDLNLWSLHDEDSKCTI